LRIAVSGPAGAGKTSLVLQLADALSLPVIEEGFLDIVAAQEEYRRSGHVLGTPPSPEQRLALSRWMASYFDWCKKREAAYEKYPSYVADRWELDILGYWMQAFVQHDPWDETIRMRDIFLRRSLEIDLVVMLPMGNFDAGARNDVGLRRQTSRVRSLITQLSFAGLLAAVPDSVGRYSPSTVEPTEKRVADIVRMVQFGDYVNVK